MRSILAHVTKNNNMKKIFLSLAMVFSLSTIQAQTSNDTIVLEGEVLGYLKNVDTGQNTEGQSTFTFNVNVFRDITKEEETLIYNKYNPGSSMNRNVDVGYEYKFNSNQALAGHLLFESGKLNTQSKNIYLATGLVAITGMLASNYINRNAGLKVDINGTVTNNQVNTTPAMITVSTTGIMSVIALVKSYKADRKTRQAGILLQKK